jgi:hypothetical protein
MIFLVPVALIHGAETISVRLPSTGMNRPRLVSEFLIREKGAVPAASSMTS